MQPPGVGLDFKLISCPLRSILPLQVALLTFFFLYMAPGSRLLVFKDVNGPAVEGRPPWLSVLIDTDCGAWFTATRLCCSHICACAAAHSSSLVGGTWPGIWSSQMTATMLMQGGRCGSCWRTAPPSRRAHPPPCLRARGCSVVCLSSKDNACGWPHLHCCRHPIAWSYCILIAVDCFLPKDMARSRGLGQISAHFRLGRGEANTCYPTSIPPHSILSRTEVKYGEYLYKWWMVHIWAPLWQFQGEPA